LQLEKTALSKNHQIFRKRCFFELQRRKN